MKLKEKALELLSNYKHYSFIVSTALYLIMVGVVQIAQIPISPSLMLAWFFLQLYTVILPLRRGSSLTRLQSISQKSRQRKNKLRQLTKVHSEYKAKAELRILELKARNRQLIDETEAKS